MSELFKSSVTSVEDASIWVGTGYLDLLTPNPARIHLTDIARALSRMARFNGHGASFYSVAEHCVNCVQIYAELRGQAIEDLLSPHRRTAQSVLLHDAAEA